MAKRRKIPLRVRLQVRLRAQYRCEYCRAPEDFSLDSFTVDHIKPVALAGTDTLDNLAFACHNCNNHKQDDSAAPDPQTGHRVPLYHPRHDRWDRHFQWSEDALEIVPLSPTGRATVARLQLNRTGAVNIRRALLALGEEHPPDAAIPDADNRQR
ncbi:MAG: HNH endonuclease [Chloroflexi bacterium]|nr:HNH endonuclease [Chloroflexota bacterium]